jgi:hypothetical protein
MGSLVGEEIVLTGMLFMSESVCARAPAMYVPSTHNDESAEAHMLVGLWCDFGKATQEAENQGDENAQMNSNKMRLGIMKESGLLVYKREQVIRSRALAVVCLL